MSLIYSVFEDYKNLIPSQLTSLITHESPLDEGEVKNRSFRAQVTISTISKTMGFSSNAYVGVSFAAHVLEVIPSCIVIEKQEGSIYLPILLFLKGKEIPFKGYDDPNVDNVQKVQKFADQLSKQFLLPKQKISSIDCHNLKMFLLFRQKPKKAKKGVLFGIGHELVHIYLGHKENKHPQQNTFLLKIPFLIKKLKFIRDCESRADYLSYSHSIKFAKGGKYLFKTMKNNYSGSITNKIINIFQRITIAFTHRSCSTRIAEIENHWPQLQNNQKKVDTMINSLFKVAAIALLYIIFLEGS